MRFSPSPARVAHVAVRYQGDGAQKALIALNRRASRRWSKRRRGSGRCEHHFQRHSRSLVGPGAQGSAGPRAEQSSRAEQRGSARLQLAASVVLSANYPSERVAGLWSVWWQHTAMRSFRGRRRAQSRRVVCWLTGRHVPSIHMYICTVQYSTYSHSCSTLST